MRLIDADAYEYPGDLVNEPTIEAEPAKYGRWVYNTDCGYNEPIPAGEAIKPEPEFYCPNCGAKMDKEAI